MAVICIAEFWKKIYVAITNGELLTEAERIIYLPKGSVSTCWDWKATVLRIAIITPFVLLGAQAKNWCGKSLWVHEGALSCAKCVSWTHNMSVLRDNASLHSLERLKGLFSPFALMVVIFRDISKVTGVACVAPERSPLSWVKESYILLTKDIFRVNIQVVPTDNQYNQEMV